MDFIDPHTHMISRVTDDYEKLALAGCRAVVEPAFWMGEARTHAETFFDYFRAICNFEAERARWFNINHFCTIAMNPREANDSALANEVLAGMEEFLSHERVVAVGEVGLDDNTRAEEEALAAQTEMARKHKLPLLVHTSHRNKQAGTRRILDIVLKEVGYDPEWVLIDHNTEETIKDVRDAGCWAGHTVYPVTKLSPERAANILEEYGAEKMMVNSSADWGQADPLSVPRTILELRKRSFSDEGIRTVVWDNPSRFFGLSGRFKPLG